MCTNASVMYCTYLHNTVHVSTTSVPTCTYVLGVGVVLGYGRGRDYEAPRIHEADQGFSSSVV